MRFVYNNLPPIWLTIAMTAAVICWFGTAVPTAPQLPATISGAWVLPKSIENESRKSVDAINARNLWGVISAAEAAAAAPPAWRIMGIAQSGKERFILLAYEGKPVEILKVGDALPDGAKILQIDNDRFFVLSAKKKKLAFGIYKNETEK